MKEARLSFNRKTGKDENKRSPQLQGAGGTPALRDFVA